ncbi:DUF6227 family protein [Streptomyces sp. NPDC004290]
MATVHHWTGLEARALRLALRLSVRAFAERLGLAVATISKWEKLRSATEPRPDTQAILDTALGRADASVHLRFETLLSEMAGPGQVAAGRRVTAAGPRAWEYESWTDDLDRAVVALSQQNFTFADSLLGRWLNRVTAVELDDKGLYLYARSTALLGDLKRDQGAASLLLGSALAHEITQVFGRPRRAGHAGLSFSLYEHAFLLRDGREVSLWEVEHTATPDGRHMCEVYPTEDAAREAMERRAARLG